MASFNGMNGGASMPSLMQILSQRVGPRTGGPGGAINVNARGGGTPNVAAAQLPNDPGAQAGAGVNGGLLAMMGDLKKAGQGEKAIGTEPTAGMAGTGYNLPQFSSGMQVNPAAAMQMDPAMAAQMDPTALMQQGGVQLPELGLNTQAIMQRFGGLGGIFGGGGFGG